MMDRMCCRDCVLLSVLQHPSGYGCLDYDHLVHVAIDKISSTAYLRQHFPCQYSMGRHALDPGE